MRRGEADSQTGGRKKPLGCLLYPLRHPSVIAPTNAVRRSLSLAMKRLTAEVQKKYSYVLSPYLEPVLTVKPGDTFIVETEDAFENWVKSEQDVPRQLLSFLCVSRVCGPSCVERAEPGDMLLVGVREIEPLCPAESAGSTVVLKEFGGLTGASYTAVLIDP